MTKPSAFNREQIRTVALGQRRGILEELHLPPEVIAFIRNNSRAMLIVSGCLLCTALVWMFYDHYQEVSRDRTAAEFAKAMQETADDKRAEGLKQIMESADGTEAARWSRLELAHMDYQAGRFAEALKSYQEVSKSISVENPLLPLITLSIAQTYEQMGEAGKAGEEYRRLIEMAGFGGEGSLGLGRLYEKDNKPDQAREVYEKYLAILSQEQAGKEQANEIKGLIEARLARLKTTASPAPAAPPASAAVTPQAPAAAPAEAK